MSKVYSTGRSFERSCKGETKLSLNALRSAQTKLGLIHCHCLNCRALRIRARAITFSCQKKGYITVDEIKNMEAITEQMKLCSSAIIVKS